MIYIPSVTSAYVSAVQPGGTRSEMQYIAGGGALGTPNVLGGIPLIKGPLRAHHGDRPEHGRSRLDDSQR